MSFCMKQIINQFARVKLCETCVCRSLHTNAGPLSYHVSATTFTSTAVPKKKKRANPLTAAKIESKKKKLNRELRKLSKSERILKPIEEMEVLPQLQREIKFGIRFRAPVELSADNEERHILLEKDWCRYKTKQHIEELKAIQRAQASQEKALRRLREVSEELYKQAIQVDENLLEYSYNGPTETPPMKDYDSLDGVYEDKTEYFLVEKKY